MEFDNTLDVPLAPADAWAVLLDIGRIAGCIPGAQLTEVVDERTYKGNVAVRFGPIALTLAGHAKLEAIDDTARSARVRARGTDSRGRGASDALIDFRLERDGEGTRVLIHTNVTLSGSIAQYGRGAGMVQALAQQLIVQFGENLKAELAQAPNPNKPISGISVMTKAVLSSIKHEKDDR